LIPKAQEPDIASAGNGRALNQKLFREANERIRHLAIHQFAMARPARSWYLCECGEPGCLELIELTPDEYDSLRAEGDLRAVLPGHESPSSDVVARTERFHTVLKDGDPADTH
jgi:hypothetical protein